MTGILTIKVGRADKGDVDTEITMIRGAVEAEIDTEGNRCPCWVLLATIEANLSSRFCQRYWRSSGGSSQKGSAHRGTNLVCRLGLQLLEELLRLLLRGERTTHFGLRGGGHRVRGRLIIGQECYKQKMELVVVLWELEVRSKCRTRKGEMRGFKA